MRKEILELLEKGKSDHLELIEKYPTRVPASMIKSSTENYDVANLKWINNILQVINLTEKKEVYKPIESYDEAIELFKNEELDTYIANAKADKENKFSDLNGETLSIEQVLEKNKSGLETGSFIFAMHLKLAKFAL